MKPHWLSDARLIPDDVMGYLRKIAIQAVKEKGYSPEDVTDMLGFSRSCIYDWLNRFSQYGYDLKFPFLNYATRSITVAISGFRVALPGTRQSIPKPWSPRSLARARRRSAKAYSVRLAVA